MDCCYISYIRHNYICFGDKWMLVIIKQMLIEDKMTFKDFTESDEAIATGILSSKLKCLQELGIITKTQLPD